MPNQQDKDFDSRIKNKMENFAKMPPPGLWESIDEELNGPAALRTNWVISGATWLMIAASVCLLAAAGLWLYRYQPFPEVDKIAIIGEKDSISSPRPGVTILNKSRSRDEAKPGADDPEGAVEQAGITTGQTDEIRPPGLPQGESGPLSEEKTRTKPEQIETFSEPVIAAARIQDRQGQVNGHSQTPVKERIEPVDKLDKVSKVAIESSARDPVPNPEALAGSEGGIMDVAMEKKSIVPREIREVGGVGDALNLVASTIDRSDDKFIRVRRDEESGKWDGIRLDLGIVTISYNKPEKKNRQQRN